MKPAVLIAVLCVLASILAALYRTICEQDHSTTSKCDVAFGVPILVLLAVACGLAGLAVLAMQDN